MSAVFFKIGGAMIKKIVTVVICLGIVFLSYVSLQRKDETYASCILRNIDKAQSEMAAKAVVSACRERFPEVSYSHDELQAAAKNH